MRHPGLRRGLLAVLLLVASSGGAEEKVEEAAARMGLKFSSDLPTSINAEELEASKAEGGGEQVIFNGAVRVEQGDLEIRCDRLEATYPAARHSGPSRLVARGNVVIRQGDSEALCHEAVFDGATQVATCRSTDGRAVLRRGTDVVEGREIFFDMARSTVRVAGGAVVRMNPPQERP